MQRNGFRKDDENALGEIIDSERDELGANSGVLFVKQSRMTGIQKKTRQIIFLWKKFCRQRWRWNWKLRFTT